MSILISILLMKVLEGQAMLKEVTYVFIHMHTLSLEKELTYYTLFLADETSGKTSYGSFCGFVGYSYS